MARLCVQLQRSRVDAIALARGPGPVGEAMPEVSAARGAFDLGSCHAQGIIDLERDRGFVEHIA